MVFGGTSLKGDDICVRWMRMENVAQTDMGASQGRRMRGDHRTIESLELEKTI